MKTYRAKKTFKSQCAFGTIVVHEGTLFMVDSIKKLPHADGKNPDYDTSALTETDHWANTDEWQDCYEEV